MMGSASLRMGSRRSRSRRMLAATLCPVPSGCGRRVSLKRRIRGRIVGLQKHQAWWAAWRRMRLNKAGKLLERGAFADVHHQRRAADVGRVLGQLGEFRDQFDGQVVHRIVAQILQGLEHGAFAGAAQAGDDHQLGSGTPLAAAETVHGDGLGGEACRHGLCNQS